MTLEEMETRLKRIEDIEAIKALKTRYCLYCDDSYNVEGLASLFTEDAVWDGGIRGKAVGKQEIRDFFTTARQRLPFAVHMVMNPLIEVDGDQATGVWYLFQACTYTQDDQAVWGSARYDEEYVREGGQWKFKSLRLTSNFWTPFDQGWAKAKFV